MLIAKDLKGKVYVAKVAEPKDRNTPGVIGEWFFIGPGQDVFISWMSGSLYLVVFKYLASNFARVFDANVWPPLQVDPVTSYNPVTLQRPESWLPAPTQSTSSTGLTGSPEDLVKTIREDPYIRFDYDTKVYTLTVGRDKTTTPVNVDKYRLYSRDIGDPLWTLHQDWSPDITGVIIQGMKPPTKEFTISWGNFWAEGFQNYPRGTHPQEYRKGPTLTVNGAVESVVINLVVESTGKVDLTSSMFSTFTDMPRIVFQGCEDTAQMTKGAGNGSSNGLFEGVYTWKVSHGLSDIVTMPSQTLFSTTSMGF